MDHLHPVMQQALAGIVPPGSRSAPVMTATKHWQGINDTLRATLASFNAPPCPAGQFLHVHQHKELGALDCHLEWEDGDPSVGWAESITLNAAFLRGVDICGRLTSAEVEVIEIEASRRTQEQGEPA